MKEGTRVRVIGNHTCGASDPNNQTVSYTGECKVGDIGHVISPLHNECYVGVARLEMGGGRIIRIDECSLERLDLEELPEKKPTVVKMR